MWKPTSIVDLFHHFFLWKPWVFNIYTRAYRVPMVFFLPWPDLPLLSALGDGILRYSAKITGGWWMNHMISIFFSSHLMSSTWKIYNDIWLSDITSNLIWVAIINMISSSLSWFYPDFSAKMATFFCINHCNGLQFCLCGFALPPAIAGGVRQTVPKRWISDETVFGRYILRRTRL